MAFQLSPGVNVSEIDLTTIVPAVGTTEGAFAGHFNWGPMNEITLISNEVDLVSAFGKPDANTFKDFFTCANFLSYARNLKVVRAGSPNTYTATAAGGTVQIKNRDDYENAHSTGASSAGIWAAKFPGELGNSIRVESWVSTNANAFSSWTWQSYFDSVPGTSSYVAGVGGQKDEMHVIVIDEKGKFTGTANTVLERFPFVSKAVDARNSDGSSNYVRDVIRDRSRYIWWTGAIANTGTGNVAVGFTFTEGSNTAAANSVLLTGGTDATPSNAKIIEGYDKFKNADEVDISLVLTSAHSTNVATHIIDNIAESRKDCVVFLSPEQSDVVDQVGSESANIVDYRKTTLNKTSSYAVMDSGWKYQFDKYNNTYRWVPLNGDIAGLCVRTDFERDPWFSPAGFNRGIIKNVVKLAWNPDKTERDELYKNGINPVVSFPGEGTILFGDKTMLAKPSAFDRINVRRLFIVLEKAIARAAKFSLFEFNDAFTRAQFVSLVEPYLRDVQGRRGIFDFRVVCDETNNTPEVIDRNEFIGDIYIKPARSINFIQLNFVAVRTGVSFDEIVGKF